MRWGINEVKVRASIVMNPGFKTALQPRLALLEIFIYDYRYGTLILISRRRLIIDHWEEK